MIEMIFLPHMEKHLVPCSYCLLYNKKRKCCCLTCRDSGGRYHGPECEKIVSLFPQYYYAFQVLPANRVSEEKLAAMRYWLQEIVTFSD